MGQLQDQEVDLRQCETLAPRVSRLIERSLRRERPTFTEKDCKSNLSQLNDLNDTEIGIVATVHREHAEDFPFKIKRQQLRDEGRRQLRSRLNAVLFGPKS
jgi:hypothetical protein